MANDDVGGQGVGGETDLLHIYDFISQGLVGDVISTVLASL